MKIGMNVNTTKYFPHLAARQKIDMYVKAYLRTETHCIPIKFLSPRKVKILIESIFTL